jgi:hypothetical protein
MDIHAAQPRYIQNGARQYQAVGDDHQNVRLPADQSRSIRLILQRSGLGDGYASLQGCELHGTGGKLTPPPFGSVGLGQDADYWMPRSGQCVKGGQGKVRRSRER